tara:strand:+ start:820 stop:1005 length:186 start_codon:yes stop_codon:yes gene_type:complete
MTVFFVTVKRNELWDVMFVGRDREQAMWEANEWVKELDNEYAVRISSAYIHDDGMVEMLYD